MRILTILLAVLSLSAMAAETKPEIVRPVATPQAVGVLHTVRTIPEACVRLEGRFTGEAAQPYRFAAVKSFPNCRPRARFVDFASVQPVPAQDWKLNDEVRIPNALCPSLQAVVRVWRKPVEVATPKLDAQGKARIYLHDAVTAAKEKAPQVPQYAAKMALEGQSCR